MQTHYIPKLPHKLRMTTEMPEHHSFIHIYLEIITSWSMRPTYKELGVA